MRVVRLGCERVRMSGRVVREGRAEGESVRAVGRGLWVRVRTVEVGVRG